MPDNRTVMASSDDRKWLTAPNEEPHQRRDSCYSAVCGWSDFLASYAWRDLAEPKGPRAEEAMQAFLDGRE